MFTAFSVAVYPVCDSEFFLNTALLSQSVSKFKVTLTVLIFIAIAVTKSMTNQ